jgi:hypothetical protein
MGLGWGRTNRLLLQASEFRLHGAFLRVPGRQQLNVVASLHQSVLWSPHSVAQPPQVYALDAVRDTG